MQDEKSARTSYFNLSKKDRLDFELEDEEKEEKKKVVDKVINKLNDKHPKND